MYLINGVTVKEGDVLLKKSTGSFTHNLIQFGQWLGGKSGGHSDMAHAAIYIGSVNTPKGRFPHAVAESVAKGLRIAPQNKLSKYSWDVWHLAQSKEVRHCAAEIASNLAIREDNDKGFGAYSTGNAFGAAFSSASGKGDDAQKFLKGLDSGNQKTRVYFCSNFVVLAYSLAAEFLAKDAKQYGIDKNYEKVTPAEMAAYFEASTHWQKVGTIKGGGW